jgi:uncharacterized SAM-binding protein YcdF (DUF218 family)
LEEEPLMFFVLSKIAGFLLLPSNFLVVLALVGLVLLATHWRRLGSWCLASGIVLLLLAGFLPAGRLLMNVLENRFPRWDAQRGAPDGIVVLGGVINPVIARSCGSLGLTHSAERIYSKQLAQPKQGERWLLVTSAYHMPRAIGCFRRAGFDVEAYPVNWRRTPRPRRGINLFDDPVHEWEGLLAYRLTGRTDALLPAP